MSDERSQEGQADRRRQPVANGSSESLSETFTIYCCVSCGTTGDKGGACPACGDQCDPVRVVAAEESEARIEQLEEALRPYVEADERTGFPAEDMAKYQARYDRAVAALPPAPPSEGES